MSVYNYIQIVYNCIIKILEIPVYLYREIDLIQSGGVEIRGLNLITIPKKKPLTNPILQKYLFVPNVIKLVNLNKLFKKSHKIFKIILYV